jgi:3-dehydroquinate synthase
MTLAFQFSAELGLCPPDEANRVKAHLGSAGLPTTLAEAGVQGPAVFDAMLSDKKATAGGLPLILVRGVGRAFRASEVDRQRLSDFLADQL